MEQVSQKTITVTILVNGSPVTFDTREVTGLDIKTKAGYPSNSELYRKDGEHLTLIANDQSLEIHDKEEFVDYPPTPVS
jgi:Multiubiquitin